MGFPATMGASFLPYLITDKVVAPDSCRHCYSENLALMPNCYFVNDYKHAHMVSPLDSLVEVPALTRKLCSVDDQGGHAEKVQVISEALLTRVGALQRNYWKPCQKSWMPRQEIIHWR
jgi:hypothetical protein